MSEDLQGLLEKINREGVEKAEAKAAEIIAEAKAKAAEIVKAAKDEAAQAKADADAAAQDFAALRPAAFGMLLTAILVFAEISVFTGPLPLPEIAAFFRGEPVQWDFSIRILPLLIAALSMFLQLKTKISFLWLIAASALLGALFL